MFCQLHEILLSVDKLHGSVKRRRKTCHSFTATKISGSANLPNPSDADVTAYGLSQGGAGLKETWMALPARAASCHSASGTGLNPSALCSCSLLSWGTSWRKTPDLNREAMKFKGKRPKNGGKQMKQGR